MEKNPVWLQDFQLTPEQVREWASAIPKGKSLVRWCIENRKIPAENFLAWAKKHYQLPTLKENFSQIDKAREIAQRYSNIWPDHVVPVADWDGTLFLACLEPVEEFHAPQKHQWILAPLSLIQRIRGEDDVIGLGSSDAAPVSEAPAGLNFEMPAGLQLEQPSAAVAEAPSGLNLDFGGVSVGTGASSAPAGLDLSGISLDASTENTRTGVFSAPPLPPEPAIVLTPPPIVAPPPVQAIVPPAPNIVPPPPPIGVSQATVLPPPIPMAPPPIPPAEPVMVVPPPAASVPAAGAVAIGQVRIKETDIRSLEDVTAYLLGEMGELFEKSMILLFSGERLEPWKWSQGWKPDPNRNKAIDLSSPSIFRIVRDSQNSYHGHVVANPINDAFFQTWAIGVHPEHVTMVPIKMANNLAGMLLGVCTKKRGMGLSLRGVEALGDKAAELLVKYRSTSKAAA